MSSRVQRKRTGGWSKASASSNPNGVVIVDRTSRFGNPFRIINGLLVEHPAGERVWSCGDNASARRWAADLYDDWLDGHGPDVYEVGSRRFDRLRVLTDLHELRGRDVACTCPLPEPGEPDHCHGARLMCRANGRPR